MYYDIYDLRARKQMLEDDEIDAAEEGFMQGYMEDEWNQLSWRNPSRKRNKQKICRRNTIKSRYLLGGKRGRKIAKIWK